jgi:hypothetical protein
MHIILVDAKQAKQLGEALVHHANLTGLRVAIEGDHVKFKINQGGWSPPMGRLDPLSDEAYKRFMDAKERNRAAEQSLDNLLTGKERARQIDEAAKATFANDVREDGA